MPEPVRSSDAHDRTDPSDVYRAMISAARMVAEQAAVMAEHPGSDRALAALERGTAILEAIAELAHGRDYAQTLARLEARETAEAGAARCRLAVVPQPR